jgi:formylglycine-generating enzyme required for sulfatase activity
MIDDPVPLMARVPAGEFIMGADDTEEDERPSHRVYLDEFYLGVHPVTNEEYARFVQETHHPSPAVRALPLIVRHEQQHIFREVAASFVWTDSLPPRDRQRHPVVLVTIDDAMAYCAWLRTRSGNPFRLPTEAEWEKAARGGLERQRFPWGDEFDPARANHLSDPEVKLQHGTQEVGRYAPNGYQLFDMAGNVWQWVSDWYTPDYYARAQYLNPPGPDAGQLRIVRGGSWVNQDADFFRCGYRHRVPDDSYSYSVGFRVAYSVR